MKKIITIFLISLSLSACGSAALDQQDKVENLRETLYFQIQGPEGWPLINLPSTKEDSIDPNLPMEEVYQNFLGGKYKWRCRELAYLFAWLLEQQGIPAREVNLGTGEYLPALKTYLGHFTTEVFLDGKWIVEDPTFNITLQCNGGVDVGVQELASCKNITWRAGKQMFGEGRRLEEYPLKFEDFLNTYQIGADYKSTLID